MSSKLLSLKTLEVNNALVFLGIENNKPLFAHSLNFCKSLFKIISIWCLSADE